MGIFDIIKNSLLQNKFIYCVFTTPRNKSKNPYKKILAEPVDIKGERVIQLEKFTDTQTFHENFTYFDSAEVLVDLIVNQYKYINLFTEDFDYQFMVSKKGNIKVTEKEHTRKL